MLKALIVGKNILYSVDPIRWLASQSVVSLENEVLEFFILRGPHVVQAV